MGMSESEDEPSYWNMRFHEPFENYAVKSNEPGPWFYGFLLFYLLLAFLLIAPLVSWSRMEGEEEGDDKEQQVNESKGKQVEIEQSKNIFDLRTPSTEDSKQLAFQETPDSSLPKGGKENPKAHNGSVRKGKKKSLSAVGSDYTRNSRQNTVVSNRSRRSTKLQSAVLRRLDQSYPDQDPDFQKRMSLRIPAGGMIENQSFNFQRGNNTNANGVNESDQQILEYGAKNNRGDSHRSGIGSNQPTENSSSVPSIPSARSAPSAATTGNLYRKASKRENPSDKGFSKLVLDVGGRRWKNRRPIGRADVIENSFASNSVRQTLSVASKNKIEGSFVSPSPKKARSAVPGNNSNSVQQGKQSSIPQQPNPQLRPSKGMSDVASSILSEQYHQLSGQPAVQLDLSLLKKDQLEKLRLQHQYQMQHQMQFFAMQRMQQQQQPRRFAQPRRFSRFGSRSVSERSASVMSSIIDDISPEDAADANDPGRGNIFIQPDENYRVSVTQSEFIERAGIRVGSAKEGCCSAPIDGLLLLAVPDREKWRMFLVSIPLTMGACSESLFRLVTLAFISQYLETNSMIAFLVVGLFVRITSEELSSAIIDALSAFVQASMDRTSTDPIKSNYIAGQYIQLAFILQVVLNIPLLVVWVLFMQPFVRWLVEDDTIAKYASDYVSVVVFAYIVQALSRTLTVVFHICGHEHFESVIDFVAQVTQVIGIAYVLVISEDDANLTTVACIQVLISLASAIAKIAYPAARGWMTPFRKGLIQNVALCTYRTGIWHLFKAAGPLLVGTIFEYSEWNFLTLFIHQLGPAEVVTWALLGSFWDFFEALTEGIGEAAANQVTHLLSVGRIDCAKKLCYGAIFMAVIQAVLVTSALYMSGQYLVVLFTTDPTIQHLMNNAIVLIGLANVVMAFSQITWSLIGAQGRFRLATFVIFFSRWLVTMPIALVCIFVFRLDLNAVSGSLVVGYSTACCALTVLLLSSDWVRLSQMMQIMNQPPLTNSKTVDKNGAIGDDIDPDDPILGLVDIDNFDDSDDSDSDGFGFGDYGDDDDDETTKHKRRSIEEDQSISQTESSATKSKT